MAGIRIPAGNRISCLQKRPYRFWAQPASHSTGTGVLSPCEQSNGSVNLTSYLVPVLRLRMSGFAPVYSFESWTWKPSTVRLECDGTCAETRFILSAKRTSPFKSAGGRQFSRMLAAELCASAVIMLDTPCSEVV